VGSLHHPLEWLRWIGRNSKRLLVLVAGFAVVGAGIAMLVLPGPGIIVVILGLAILATEFAWAERALDRTTSRAASATSKVTASRAGRLALGASAASMVLGGLVVTIFYGKQRGASIGIVVAGLIALVTLEPRVQRWIDAKANGDEANGDEARADSIDALDLGDEPDGPATNAGAAPADDH
jgi:uncharacterized protein (TIGR02611 family)